MRRVGLTILVAALALAGFALSVLSAEPPAPGARHWASAPLLAFSILFVMGGLVALATARLGSLK